LLRGLVDDVGHADEGDARRLLYGRSRRVQFLGQLGFVGITDRSRERLEIAGFVYPRRNLEQGGVQGCHLELGDLHGDDIRFSVLTGDGRGVTDRKPEHVRVTVLCGLDLVDASGRRRRDDVRRGLRLDRQVHVPAVCFDVLFRRIAGALGRLLVDRHPGVACLHAEHGLALAGIDDGGDDRDNARLLRRRIRRRRRQRRESQRTVRHEHIGVGGAHDLNRAFQIVLLEQDDVAKLETLAFALSVRHALGLLFSRRIHRLHSQILCDRLWRRRRLGRLRRRGRSCRRRRSRSRSSGSLRRRLGRRLRLRRRFRRSLRMQRRRACRNDE
jgi:hypothetical protein